MSSSQFEDGRPSIPQKIGCRVCLATAKLTEVYGEDRAGDAAAPSRHAAISYGVFRCEEGHITHAVFDRSDGSLRIYEPEDGAGNG